MDVLEDLMSKRKWKKQCLRANVAQPEDIVTYGTVKVAKIYSNVLNKREKEPELYDAMKEIAPEWWGDDTQITLNKDLMCKRHRDHGNKEHSWILCWDTTVEETCTSTTALGLGDRGSGTRSMDISLIGTTLTKEPSTPSVVQRGETAKKQQARGSETSQARARGFT